MRKIIKKLHLYFALALCLPLILQGLSGAILVFEKEISERKVHDTQNHSPSISLAEAIKTAQEKIPEGYSASLVKFDEVTKIRFTKNGDKKSALEASLNPISLEIIEIKSPKNNFFNFVKKFHTNIFIEGKIGRNIVGIYGLVLLFMAFSGLVLWWPKPGKSLRKSLTFKIDAQGYRFHRDLHGAIGFWFLIPLLIVSFAGVYLAYPSPTTSAISTFFPARDLKALANEIKVQKTQDFFEIDDVIKLAQSTNSGEEKLTSIAIPTKSDQPYRVNFLPKNYQYGAPPITVFVDPWQKKIIEKRDPNFYSIGEKIIAWQHALHTGEGFGLIWKIPVFLVGFLPLFFSITGITLWMMKKKKRS